jgi:hypothetical protein
MKSVIMMMVMMVMVMMVTTGGRMGMRLAGGVRRSGDGRAGDAEAQNKGGQYFFHDRFSSMRTPARAHGCK